MFLLVLVWDQRKLSQSRFVFFDCTTFSPYTEEISYENSLLVQQSSTLGMASLVHVFASLTFNAKAIFILIADQQLENKSDSNYLGNRSVVFFLLCYIQLQFL